VKRHPRRRSVPLASALVLAILLGGPLRAQQKPAATEPTDPIAEVRIAGNRAVPTQKIMAEIHTRAGVPPDRALIEQDVRRLMATRQFFDVGVEFLNEPHGLVVLFRVLEGNQIREVVIEGNQAIATNKLRDKAALKADKPFDIARVKDAARVMEDLYHDKGYPFARVSVAEGTQPGDKRLVFEVAEGPKVAITDVDFEFLDHDTFGARRLATQIKSKARKFGFLGGQFNGRDIDDDVQRLRAYYLGLGFFDIRVSRELRESDDRSKVEVHFVISEGPRYTVRSLQFNGNQRLDEDALREALKLQPGQVFDQKALQADTQKVQDRYGALGHIEAKVNPDIRFLEQPGAVDVVYDIKEGEPYSVGRIFVTGNHTTRDNVIRRELRIYPGELINTVEMRKSEANLKKLQIFQTNYQQGIGPTLTPADEGPTLRDIEVRVEEGQTGRVLFGLGVNSDAGLLGNIIVSEQNFDITRFPATFDDFLAGDAFRGGGQEFRLEAAPGTQFSRYLASWRDPRIFDLPYSFGVSGHFFQRMYPEYDEERAGAQFTLGHEFTDQIRGSVGLRVENVNITHPDVPTPHDLQVVLGNNFLTVASLGLEHDTRDNPFIPTCGHLTSVLFEQGFGDFTYPKLTVEGDSTGRLWNGPTAAASRCSPHADRSAGPATTRRCSSGSTPAASATSAVSSSAA
jgi:outer membrane protein insertion porin family